MKRFLPVVFFTLLAVPLVVFAQGLVPCGSPGLPDCTLCHLFQLLYNIINWVLFVLIPILAPIFVVIGGLYLLIGRGNPETYSKGKSVLTATVIGLIIVYTAYVLLSTVLTLLGVMAWTGLETWWQPECAIPE